MNSRKYPKHEYSKYIDTDFSFSNRVYPSKIDIVDKLKNMRCDGGMMLEPRLQEYLKKKAFYKKNNIKPCIKPEEEYQITSRDKRALRAFLKGRTNIYNPQLAKIDEDGQCRPGKTFFPSKGFRDDPRVPKLKKKNKNVKPINRGMFVPDNEFESYYEDPIREDVNPMMDSRDFSNKDISGFSLNDSRFDPRTDPYIEPGPEKFSKYNSQYRINPGDPPYNPKQDPDPRNNYIISDLGQRNQECKNNSGLSLIGTDKAYSTYDSFQRSPNFNLINKDDRKKFYKNSGYGDFAEPSFSERSHMDTDNKMVIPKLSSGTKRDLNTSKYRMMPYFADPEKSEDVNIDLETAMIRGMPSNTTKSYGYRNPAEHFYQYVDPAFNDERFVVEPWIRGGVSTRRDNKALAKQRAYRRHVM